MSERYPRGSEWGGPQSPQGLAALDAYLAPEPSTRNPKGAGAPPGRNAPTGSVGLLLAILDRAVKDVQLRAPEAHEAWVWLYSDTEHPGSLVWVASLLDLDVAQVRQGLRQRQLHTEPPHYPPKPHTRQEGVGCGGWTHEGTRVCKACGLPFWAKRIELTHLCDACRRARYPWKKARAA